MEDQNMDFYKLIGSRIRDIRIQKGMSQADLAVKAKLSLPAVSAEALDVSADDILRLSTPPSTASYPEEFAEILQDCTAGELEAILKITKQLKSTFDKQKKEYTE